MRPKMIAKKHTDLIEKINSTYSVGDKINVKQDNGEIIEWTMTAPASILGGHSPVIWIKENVVCYAAERVIFPKAERIIVTVHFEDKMQDLQYFKISFYPDYFLGQVIEAGPFHNSLYNGYFVLSGKPEIGKCMTISKSPTDEVLKIKYKISEII